MKKRTIFVLLISLSMISKSFSFKNTPPISVAIISIDKLINLPNEGAFINMGKQFLFRELSVEKMNDLLPPSSNWRFVSHGAYHVTEAGRKLHTANVMCVCGKRDNKIWERVMLGDDISCGCIIRNGRKQISSKDLDGETWKSVAGYEEYYQISNLGRLKALTRLKRRGKYTTVSKEKFISALISRDGYLRYSPITDIDGNKKTFSVHRLIAQHFIPNLENKPQINHINGIKTDNRIENLEWCTHSENVRHSYDTGLNKGRVGEENNKTKLTKEQVLEIRSKYVRKTYGSYVLGREYGVSDVSIRNIINGKTWKHI